MGDSSWPSQGQLNGIKKVVSEMSGKDMKEVRVVVSPYRICPLGAHIDHQGGTVLAMTINRGILLGSVPSGDTQNLLEPNLAKRAEHYFSENMRVIKGLVLDLEDAVLHLWIPILQQKLHHLSVKSKRNSSLSWQFSRTKMWL